MHRGSGVKGNMHITTKSTRKEDFYMCNSGIAKLIRDFSEDEEYSLY